MIGFQTRINAWMLRCFGKAIRDDKVERNYRFFEEAGELVQALGMTEQEAIDMVRYTWSRPIGSAPQEVGGVMVTLASLCNVHEISIDKEMWREENRISQPAMIEKIRQKQATKADRGVGVIP